MTAWRLRGTSLSLLAMAMSVTTACATSSVQVIARGVLTYCVATSVDTIVSVELSERFELVVRDGGSVRRLDLGPPEIDLRALAVQRLVAYIGSDAGFVFEVDLRTLHQTRVFAVGSPIQALAVDDNYLVSADASGAVCLRRRGDGALLQCALAPSHVTAMTISHETLWLQPYGPDNGAANGADVAATTPWSLPGLAATTPPSTEKLATELRWQGGTLRVSGPRLLWDRGNEHRVLIQLATSIRAVAMTASGDLVVAAWPKSLDDAALVRVTP
jgi:hypothetical protein